MYRAFSSAGLEHLPYKQRVGGSNPSTPTGVFPRGFLFGEAAGIFFVYTPWLFKSRILRIKYLQTSLLLFIRYIERYKLKFIREVGVLLFV